MKTFNFTVAIFLSLFIFTVTTSGQTHTQDSVNISIDSEVKISMAIYLYKDLGVTIEKDLKSLQTILKEEEVRNPDLFSNIIQYEPDKRLAIKPNISEETIIWENGKPIYQVFPYQVQVLSNHYYLQIQSTNTDRLISESLVTQILQAVDSTNLLQNRHSRTYNYTFKGLELTSDHMEGKRWGESDYITWTLGVGANLIKNQPVVDLLFELAYTRKIKGISRHQLYVTYHELYDFSNTSKINQNGFVSLGHRHNISQTKKKDNWIGAELGYLVLRQGDMFNKNTFRFGINWSAQSRITISPQLYLARKNSYPAIRIGFGL